jgi:hypothetical protein
MKVSTIVGKNFQFGLYGSAGVNTWVIPVTYHPNVYWIDDEYMAPIMASSLMAGAEIGGKNKITAGINIKNGIIPNKPKNSYMSELIRLGYKRETVFRKTKVNASVGIFNERISLLNSYEDAYGQKQGIGYDRKGLELGLEYERALNRNLYINGRVGFSQAFEGLSRMQGGDYDREGNRMVNGPNSGLSVNVGLHYKFRPELDMPNLDLSRKKQPKRKAVKSNVPCYAYPKSSVLERSTPYNSPRRTNR